VSLVLPLVVLFDSVLRRNIQNCWVRPWHACTVCRCQGQS